eukprot:TRINITY_DN4218_c0_g1_i1.p2 TRINITY_DN4218_c0_g1~~TRINITY_DN4218_c0_g1_i1.p2  ORF type:complete len:161 (+),score=44.98 TRINITY_DN4218_c0_g1_i1:163-645(+)
MDGVDETEDEGGDKPVWLASIRGFVLGNDPLKVVAADKPVWLASIRGFVLGNDPLKAVADGDEDGAAETENGDDGEFDGICGEIAGVGTEMIGENCAADTISMDWVLLIGILKLKVFPFTPEGGSADTEVNEEIIFFSDTAYELSGAVTPYFLLSNIGFV